MGKLNVTLCGIPLDNPVIPASGTFGYGYEFAELYDINLLGTFSFKGTTREPRYGNPLPRIAECTAGIVNSIGLQNPGVDKVIAEELPKLKKVFHKPVMANVSGFSAEEYVEVIEKLEGEEQIGWYEVNISCPNVKKGGASFGMTPEGAETVTKAVKAVTKKPCIMKLTPSGPATFPVALRMVYQVYEAVKIPIVGIGGVSSAEDAVEMMLAGATAVGVGAANCVDPWASKKIVEDLPRVMEKYGIGSLGDIVGGAH